MIKEFLITFQSFFDTHTFISKNKLWKWILIPGIIYCILFVLGLIFYSNSISQLIHFLLENIGVDAWLRKMQSTWLGFLFTLISFVIWLLFMLLYVACFTFVWLIIGSPLFAYLSEKTESIIEQKEFEFSWKQLMKDAVRGAKIALRNFLLQSAYITVFILVSFLPIIGWIAPLITFLIECYFLGFVMLDYSFERNKYSPKQTISFVRKHRGLAIGNGLVYYVLHLIPILGWIIAPTYTVIAATISFNKIKKINGYS